VRDSRGGTDARRHDVAYAERLYVTWYWWPLPLLIALILAAEIHGALGGGWIWPLPYVVLLGLTVALILQAGRARITVSGGELRVGDARLPLSAVNEVEWFGPQEKRRVLGPHLDPAAQVLHRGWVGPVLRVRHTDPADPAPYWLFSTRKPEQLAEILRAAK
jgi:hypothetical protein